ncbi:LOW QUALITY PROTEIN: SKP1 component, dimerization [Dillenia turbinata]|uniref:SKP1-like protein n=1 Tax=Dillenia turbinata TaxID=194707 RepID=A0AAN8Z4D1_9MAGN
MAETTIESPPRRKINLRSAEGELFENVVVPIPNVKTDLLSKIIDFCKAYLEKKSDAAAMKAFKKEFAAENWNILLDLMTAANYLNTKRCMCFYAVASRMKTMWIEEVREYFGVVNDYTPEEEQEYRAKNKWASVISP